LDHASFTRELSGNRWRAADRLLILRLEIIVTDAWIEVSRDQPFDASDYH